MSDTQFTEILSGLSFLEGPRWHEGRLWVSDFYTHKVLAVDGPGRAETICEVPGQPSGLGWLPDGRLLVVSMTDRKLMRREADGRLVVHADLSGIAGGLCNDMVVDAQGRAYVGNFGFDFASGGQYATTKLALVQPDGTASVAAEGLYFPNGSMITPDGKTLIVGETFGNRISAFAIGENGQLGPRRDWATFAPPPPTGDLRTTMTQMKVAVDGATLDAEGAVWFADAMGNRVVRVAEGGKILQDISTGDIGVFACMLGGEDRRTLYLCVAPDSVAHKRQAAREAALWSVRVDVPGAGLP